MSSARVDAGRRAPGLSDLVELRLLLAWRRLRGPGGAAQGVAQLVLFGLAVPAALLFAALLGVGSWRAARLGQGLQATVTLGAMLFGVWQTWTAVGLTLNERDALDLRRLLIYPVPPARLYLLGVGASLLGDPFSILWVLLLGGVAVGAFVGRPGSWILLLAVALALFAAATVALVALLQEVFERWSRSRLWRELVLLAGVAGWLLLLASGAAGAGTLRTALPVLRQLRWVLFPPALTLEAAAHLYARQPWAALPWLLALGATAGATGFAAYRLAHADARSGGGASGPRQRGTSGGPSAIPEWLGPLFEKELRYLARHPAARVYALALPALAALVGWRPPMRLEGQLAPLAHALPLFFLAVYVHLGFQAFWVNGFAWERGGARVLYLAPIAPEGILAAKNAALLTCSTAVFLLSGAAYVSTAGWPERWAVAGALALQLGLAPVLYGLGNPVSILWPRAAPAGFQRGGAIAPLAALAAMGITSAASLLFALPVLAALWLDRLWLVPVAWGLLGTVAAAAWRLTLPLAAGLLRTRREQLLAAVTGDLV